MAATTNDIYIGNNPPTSTNKRQFSGIIDEVKIYNMTLSEDDIRNDYKINRP